MIGDWYWVFGNLAGTLQVVAGQRGETISRISGLIERYEKY